MKRCAAVAVVCALCACGGGNGATHATDENPTSPPGGLFRDGLLYAAVKARLAGSDIDSTTRVSVIVHDGVVTLRGTIKDTATKEHEADLVRRMRGVKSVDDQLRVGRVGPSTAQTVSNLALVAAVEGALTAQAGVNVTGVKVTADHGQVTLSGHAATAALKSTLAAAARHTPGVRNVVDRIAVKD